MENFRYGKKRPFQPPPARGGGWPRPQTRPEMLNQYIPQFLKPCKVLVRNMKPIITELAEKSEKKLLVDLIRSQLRKTIALLLENRDYMPSVQIVKLYREYYPKSTDAEVVIKNLEHLRASHWPVTNPGNANYAKPQSSSGVHKKKTNTQPQAKSVKTASPPTPVTNIKQQPKENIAKKAKVEEIKADSKVQETNNIKNNIKVEQDTQVQQNITAKKDSKVQEESLAQVNSNVQQDSSAQECSNSQQLSFSQKNSKTQEDSKVQEHLKIEAVPKAEIKNDHNETNSTVNPQRMENDDDDWIEYGLDSDENSQGSSTNQE